MSGQVMFVASADVLRAGIPLDETGRPDGFLVGRAHELSLYYARQEEAAYQQLFAALESGKPVGASWKSAFKAERLAARAVRRAKRRGIQGAPAGTRDRWTRRGPRTVCDHCGQNVVSLRRTVQRFCSGRCAVKARHLREAKERASARAAREPTIKDRILQALATAGPSTRRALDETVGVGVGPALSRLVAAGDVARSGQRLRAVYSIKRAA